LRLLYVVQRYGVRVVGGAETACRMFAEKLVERGHEVTVLTSCASSFVSWENDLPPGDRTENGVLVRRVPVIEPRDPVGFARIHSRVMDSDEVAGISDQREWLLAAGPRLRNLAGELRRASSAADAAVFMTYMYAPTAFGVPLLAGSLPVVLQPTAHDEPSIRIPHFRSVFFNADALLYLTEEERETVFRVFGSRLPGVVTGIGIDPVSPSDRVENFRRNHGLGDDPYLVYVGRIDTFKGVAELMRFFVEFKGRNPSDLRLVLVGDRSMQLPDVADIRYVGFLDEHDRNAAIAGSVALVQPSPFESFSMVLSEAWMQRRPVLVQGRSDVMVGQCHRSGGGLPYRGFAEFEGCLGALLGDPGLADELGRNGREWVTATYGWNSVLDRFEEGVELASRRFALRWGAAPTSVR